MRKNAKRKPEEEKNACPFFSSIITAGRIRSKAYLPGAGILAGKAGYFKAEYKRSVREKNDYDLTNDVTRIFGVFWSYVLIQYFNSAHTNQHSLLHKRSKHRVGQSREGK